MTVPEALVEAAIDDSGIRAKAVFRQTARRIDAAPDDTLLTFTSRTIVCDGSIPLDVRERLIGSLDPHGERLHAVPLMTPLGVACAVLVLQLLKHDPATIEKRAALVWQEIDYEKIG